MKKGDIIKCIEFGDNGQGDIVTEGRLYRIHEFKPNYYQSFGAVVVHSNHCNWSADRFIVVDNPTILELEFLYTPTEDQK